MQIRGCGDRSYPVSIAQVHFAGLGQSLWMDAVEWNMS